MEKFIFMVKWYTQYFHFYFFKCQFHEYTSKYPVPDADHFTRLNACTKPASYKYKPASYKYKPASYKYKPASYKYSLTCLHRNLTNPDTCQNRRRLKVPANLLYIVNDLTLANPVPVYSEFRTWVKVP